MDTFFVIVDRDHSLASTYLKRRKNLKDLLQLSKSSLWNEAYPEFALTAMRIPSDKKYEPLLNEYLDTLDKGLTLQYGGAYQEFAMFCDINYKLYGTQYLEERTRW